MFTDKIVAIDKLKLPPHILVVVVVSFSYVKVMVSPFFLNNIPKLLLLQYIQVISTTNKRHLLSIISKISLILLSIKPKITKSIKFHRKSTPSVKMIMKVVTHWKTMPIPVNTISMMTMELIITSVIQ